MKIGQVDQKLKWGGGGEYRQHDIFPEEGRLKM
jgi:hypothetical protein